MPPTKPLSPAHPVKLLLIAAVIAFGAFLRLWNFSGALQFLGDQGRDAITAKEILIDHNLTLIGPVTSTGNMYLGPLYYYFMAPFLALTYPSPVGPAYAVAVLSIATVLLTYFAGKELFGETEAIIAAVLMSLSAQFVYFAHFSWNPNPAPLFTVILLWATYRAVVKHPKYWLLVGLCLAVLLQLHYLTLLFFPPAALIWMYQVWLSVKKRRLASNTKKSSPLPLILFGVGSVVVVVASLAPLIVFDIRHQFLNSQSFIHFMTADLGPNQQSVVDKAVLIATRTVLRTSQTLVQEFIWPSVVVGVSLSILLTAALFELWKKNKTLPLSIQLTLVYLICSLLGLGYYRGAIFSHYFLFLLPLSMFLWGVVLSEWLKQKRLRILSLLVFALFAIFNFSTYELHDRSSSISQIEKTTESILQKVKPGEKYSIVLLSDSGDIEGQNYRYFLLTSNRPPLKKELWGTIDTLFIINEDHKLKKVTDSPIYEIVVFPNKTPAEVYTIPNGPEITVLRRFQ